MAVAKKDEKLILLTIGSRKYTVTPLEQEKCRL